MSGPLAIFGAGAAGLGAALAAARGGAEVLLLEAGPRPGGTVLHALIHTLGGFYDSAGKILNPGLSEEFLARLKQADPAAARRRMGRLWVFSVDPRAYARAIQDWIAQTPRIRFCPSARLEAHTPSGTGVEEVEVQVAQETLRIRPRAVVDATGNASLIRVIAPQLVRDDPASAGCGLIFRVRGTPEGWFDFPKGPALLQAIRAAVAMKRLPEACGRVWIDRGVRADELYFKWSLPPAGDPARVRVDEQAAPEWTGRQRELLDFLRQCDPEFSSSEPEEAGCVGIRDSGSVEGEYRLSEADLLGARTFPDPACRCAWPIEFWDSEAGVRLRHLPPGASYQIPMRSLRLRDLKDVRVAGKCFSGDPAARASARVAGCCFAMGEAVGRGITQDEPGLESLLPTPLAEVAPGMEIRPR